LAIYLRQICLVAEHLEPVVETLESVLAIAPCYIDPHVGQFGLENTLLALGSGFIEVVAPITENTAAGRYLQRRQGDGGYMVICQVKTEEEQQQCRDRAADQGVRIAWEHEQPGWKIMQLHPGDMRAAFFEIDWEEAADVTGHWSPAGGNGWQETLRDDCVSEIVGVELQGPDPEALAAHWAAVAGSQVELENGNPTVALANARLRFVKDKDGRGPGLGGVEIAVRDRDSLLAQARSRGAYVSDTLVMIGGVRFRLAA
jgi:hypothetical protein